MGIWILFLLVKWIDLQQLCPRWKIKYHAKKRQWKRLY